MPRITLDTSVLYQGIYSKRGTAYQILQLIGRRELALALTVPVFFEYQAVLYRPASLQALGLTHDDVDALLDMLVLVGETYSVSYLLRPNLPDEGDNIFVECAFVSRSDYLITSNIRDFVRGELRGLGFTVCTPSAFYAIWRQDHG